MTNRTRLRIIFAQMFVFQAGFGLVVPVLPLYAETFGVGAVGVGAVVAIYGLARVITDLPAASLAGRIGHARAMACGAATLAVGTALCAVAGSYGELLAYRALAGAGAAITLVVGQAMVLARPEPYGRARAMSYYQGAFLAGVGLGPSIGGPIADNLGLAAPFLIYSVLASLVALAGFVLLREDRPRILASSAAEAGGAPTSSRDAAGRSGDHRHRDMLRDGPFVLVSTLTLLFHLSRTGAIHALVPLLGAQRFSLTATQIGAAMTLTGGFNLLTTLAAGRAADRFGRKLVLVPGCMLLATGLATYVVSEGQLLFYVAAALWGVGSGLSGPIAAVYATDRVAGDDYTGPLALYRALSDVGYVVGPLLLGFTAATLGIPTTFAGTAVVILIFTVVFAHYSPEGERAVSPV